MQEQDPEQRGTRIGIDLFLASRALEAAAYDAVRAAGVDDVTLAQARLLARIDPNGTRLVVLAERARVSKQTAAHLVGELERAGYVERRPDPSDGRARLILLTERAHRLVPVADGAVVAMLERWRDHVGATRLRDLAETLGLLTELTDPAP